MNVFVYDILEIIFDKLDFISQIRLCQIECLSYTNIHMTDFYDIPKGVKSKLCDNILRQYQDITKLDASDNSRITNVNHFKQLMHLDASGKCGIDQDGIAEPFNLVGLNVTENSNITSLNHLKRLQELDAMFNCGIDQSGIAGLHNLVRLNAGSNSKITSVNHLKRLEKLDATSICWGECGIDQIGIAGLRSLIVLNSYSNPKITSVNHLQQLRELYAGKGITQEGIADLRGLIRLKLPYNKNITSVNHLTQLRELDACYSGIDQAGIAELRNLIRLNISADLKIGSVNHLEELQELEVYTHGAHLGEYKWEIDQMLKLYAEPKTTDDHLILQIVQAMNKCGTYEVQPHELINIIRLALSLGTKLKISGSSFSGLKLCGHVCDVLCVM